MKQNHFICETLKKEKVFSLGETAKRSWLQEMSIGGPV
jgi:hypothetical protein